MTTIINADTITGGAIITGDASGNLALQSGGVTGLTVSSGGAVTFSGAVSGAPGGNVQVFTSNGTFTVPASGQFKVTIIGGGGSGGSVNSISAAGGSGGGAGTSIKWFTGATPSAIATVTIGTGGAAVTDVAGNSGGASTFVLSGFTTLTANGGSGGARSNTGGNGGTATGGSINITGQRGGNTVVDSTGNFRTSVSSLGGSSLMGLGGCSFQNFTAVSATGYGGGGTGGGNSPASISAAGSDGICIVEY